MLNLTKSKIPLKPITTQLTRQYSTIKNIYAREVLTSNGIPTIEAIVETEKGFFRGISTSSLSTGKHNSKDLRDNDSARYNGMGVLKAIEKVESVIKPALVGKDPTCQFDLDRLLVEELDGTKDDYGWSKANLGTNTINAVSLAIARAGAKEKRVSFF
jgi:enolase